MENLPPFIPGIELNRLFYQQVIRALLDKHYPGLAYAAGIVGEGSDVMRFDNPQSMDHNWGPHMRIFLNDEDFKRKDEISEMFRKELPLEFMGFPTNYTKEVETYLVQQMKPIKRGPVNHLIQFYTVESFFQHYLGVNPHKKLGAKDWLTFPQQALIEVTAGELYHNDLPALKKAREKFAYYPDDVWLFMYMIQWGKIGNIEAYMGRTGEVGDEIGSQIIANQIVKTLMELCFLFEKQYMPYAKWFGSGFSRLKAANELTHIFLDAVHGKNWHEREEHLGRAYEIIIRLHNELGLTKPFQTGVSEFEGRPYKVIHAFEIYNALYEKVDPFFKNLRWPMGAVDQYIDHTKLTRMDYIWRELTKLVK